MPRITDYSEDTNPSQDSEIAIVQNSTSYKAKLKNLGNVPFRNKAMPMVCDFLSPTKTYPLDIRLGGGTFTQIASIANHPGIIRLNSAIASGGIIMNIVGQSSTTLAAGEQTLEASFRVLNFTSLYLLVGWSSSFLAAGYDTATLRMNSGNCVGYTQSGGLFSTTPTNYPLSLNTWYTCKIKVNATATQVDFFLYDENGALLWSDSLTTNIPTATTMVSRLGAGWVATPAGNLVDVDYMAVYYTKYETR